MHKNNVIKYPQKTLNSSYNQVNKILLVLLEKVSLIFSLHFFNKSTIYVHCLHKTIPNKSWYPFFTNCIKTTLINYQIINICLSLFYYLFHCSYKCLTRFLYSSIISRTFHPLFADANKYSFSGSITVF